MKTRMEWHITLRHSIPIDTWSLHKLIQPYLTRQWVSDIKQYTISVNPLKILTWVQIGIDGLEYWTKSHRLSIQDMLDFSYPEAWVSCELCTACRTEDNNNTEQTGVYPKQTGGRK